MVNKSGLSFDPRGVKEENVDGVADVQWDPSVQFSERRVNDGHGGYAEKREVSGVSDLVFGKNFETYRLVNMNGVIVLDNGKFLINDYGKYQPNLSFLNDAPEVKFEEVDGSEINFDRGRFSVIYGEFFVSKKGTNCFRILPKERAKHVLIRDDWGGAFNSYRGETLPEEGAVYYRRASSNRGGAGYDYGIYDVNFRNEVSEDDI